MNRSSKLSQTPWFCLILILLACVITVVLPILVGGLHSTGDLGIFLSFAQDFRSGICNRDPLPAWTFDNLGFGSVGIRFYPPLAPYTIALIDLITTSWYHSIWIYFFGWMIIGCSGIYLFVREWGSPIQGALAGALYAIVPFQLAEIFQFSLYAEFAAGSLLPFCFLFITRICNRRKWADVLCFAISFALLILCHIPTTIIAGISLLIYVSFLIERPFLKRTILRLVSAGGLALLASAFYWVKVVTEVSWLAHYEDKYSTGLAGYQEWLFPISITARDAPYYYLPIYRSFDAMIILTFFLFVPMLTFVAIRHPKSQGRERRVGQALVISAAFGFFMLSQPSAFIWSKFELLRKIQFPWRWLTVLSAMGTAAFVLSVSGLFRVVSAYRTIITVLVVGLVALMIAYDIRKSFANPNRITRNEFEAMVKAGDTPAGTNFEAWWPVWANARALETTNKVIAAGRRIEIFGWENQDRDFTVGEGLPTTLRIATFYYPYWRATVNDSRVELGKDENGAITVPIGQASSHVNLHFEEPVIDKVALLLSIITWAALLALMGHYLVLKRRQAVQLNRG